MDMIKKAFVVMILGALSNSTIIFSAMDMDLCVDDSPLHQATRDKNANLVAQLLAVEADPNVLDEENHTPFFYACTDPVSENPEIAASQYDIIRLLYCAFGDDPSLTNFNLYDKPKILKAIFYADRDLTLHNSVIPDARPPHPLKVRMRRVIKSPEKRLIRSRCPEIVTQFKEEESCCVS